MIDREEAAELLEEAKSAMTKQNARILIELQARPNGFNTHTEIDGNGSQLMYALGCIIDSLIANEATGNPHDDTPKVVRVAGMGYAFYKTLELEGGDDV